MSVRDLLVAAIVLASLPVALFRPWIGILVWSWISYMSPHRLTWGFAYTMPVAFMASLATVGGMILTRAPISIPRDRTVNFLILLWVVFFLSSVFDPLYPIDAWDQLIKVSKILLATFLTIILCQKRERLRLLLWVIALSIGFFAVKGGIFAFLTRGQLTVFGPSGSFIEGNNELGLAMNMNVPILVYLRRDERNPWLKRLLLVMFGLSVVAILTTYSRGAAVGLVMVLGLLFLKARSKLAPLFLLVIAVPIVLAVLPARLMERYHTIQTYQEDASAMGRIRAWQLAMRLAADRPLLGGGFRPFTPETYARYMPERPELMYEGADAHNIFFQVLAEHGVTGLVLYVGLVVVTLADLRRVVRRTKSRPELRWLHHYGLMMEGSVVAYVVTGFFLSLSYFDLYFHFIAVAIILKELLRVAEKEAALAPALAPEPVAAVAAAT